MLSAFASNKVIPDLPERVQKAIAKVAYKPLLHRYLRSFYKHSKPGPSNGKRVLLFAAIGAMYVSPVEILMYHLLRKEGYEVDYLVYDASIATCEVVTRQVVREGRKEKLLREIADDTASHLAAARVSYTTVKEPAEVESILTGLENDLDAILSFKMEGIEFGEIIRNVLFRYFKSLSFADDATAAASDFLRVSLTNYFQVKELISKNRYDFALFSHGIYASWEPVAELCRQEKLRFICYDRAKTSGTFNFNINQAAPDWSMDDAWRRYLSRDLKPEEHQWVKDYLGERESQKNDVFSYNFSGRTEDLEGLRAFLGIPPGSRVITLFTNLIWDAANVARDIAFPTFADCIVSTIQYFAQSDDVHVLVRSHPAEKVLGTQERYSEVVRRRFRKKLPKNVTLVEPEMDINSFSIIDISDIGVINTSTVGLEFAMLGKPAILISHTHYRGKGFTFDVESSEDYFATLDRLLRQQHLMPAQVKLAEKYFYMMMALYQQKMPITFWKSKFNGYGYKSLDQMPTSERICHLVKMFGDPSLRDLVSWATR